MTPAKRILGAILALILCAGLWYAYDQITLLRRSFWWEYRYVLLLVGGFLMLSLIDGILSRLASLFDRNPGKSDTEQS